MEQVENELDLRELISMIWKRLWIILAITFLTTAASGVYSFFLITPQYQASTQMLINQASIEGQTNQGDIRTNLELINTYNVIVKSPRILDLVISEYGLNKSYQQLNNKIVVNSVKNSQVMSITVTDPSYEQAAYIANAIAHTFQREVVQLMKVDNVHIMAEAKENVTASPVSPKPYLNMAIAFVVGMMTAVGLIFLLEYLDNTIRTEQDIEKILGLPVLGSISKMDEKTEKKLKKNLNNQVQVGGNHLEI